MSSAAVGQPQQAASPLPMQLTSPASASTASNASAQSPINCKTMTLLVTCSSLTARACLIVLSRH
jgi:hypothetical protein